MICNKNGIKREGESCTLNNNCIYPECQIEWVEDEIGNKFGFKGGYTKTPMEGKLYLSDDNGHIDENGKITWKNPPRKIN